MQPHWSRPSTWRAGNPLFAEPGPSARSWLLSCQRMGMRCHMAAGMQQCSVSGGLFHSCAQPCMLPLLRCTLYSSCASWEIVCTCHMNLPTSCCCRDLQPPSALASAWPEQREEMLREVATVLGSGAGASAASGRSTSAAVAPTAEPARTPQNSENTKTSGSDEGSKVAAAASGSYGPPCSGA